MSGPQRPELSVVLPMYNEEGVAVLALDEIRRQLTQLGTSFEILCVDDGSVDGTLAAVMAAAAADPRVQSVVLSRNYGKEAALAAGMSCARGAAVLLMDSDLQHPPELIPELVARWRSGFDVVNAVKTDRGQEGLLYRGMAWVFNRLMGSSANASFQGASDFKLLDRQVVDALESLPEKTRFFRGLVAWVGFRTTDVGFQVAPRAGGTTKWSTRQLLRYSLRNLISFSEFPLKVVAALGFSTLLFAGVVAIQTLYRYLTGTAFTGFTTVILLQLALGGLLLASVGVVALYLAQLYAEVKGRPTFIVRRERDAVRVDRAANQVANEAANEHVSSEATNEALGRRSTIPAPPAASAPAHDSRRAPPRLPPPPPPPNPIPRSGGRGPGGAR